MKKLLLIVSLVIILNKVGQAKSYIIRGGDTLWGIAHKFNTTVAALLKHNPNLKEDAINPGTVISVPPWNNIVIVKEDLNLRATPSLEGKVLCVLKKGRELTKLSTKGDWYKVNINNKTGWVFSKYVTSSNITSTSIKVTTPEAKIRYVNGEEVNLRKHPSLNSSVITIVNQGEKVWIEDYKSKWAKVKLTNGRKGWIYEKYLSKEKNCIRYIKEDCVNFRSSPSLNSNIITTLSCGEKIIITKTKGVWAYGSLKDGRKGWVHRNYITSSGSSHKELSYRGGIPNIITQLLSYAYKYMGTPYQFGSAGPWSFDCSGFVFYLFNHFGIAIYRCADEQFNQGTPVSYNQLRPGDLVFFTTYTAGPSHVGIYIGGGKFIHASYPAGVRINSIEEKFYSERFLGGRRLFSY